MEILYRTHDYLLRNLPSVISRSLEDEIDADSPIIGILGARGVGKTTFLLDFARKRYDLPTRQCLYVNLNQFFFAQESIVDFAERFVANDGRLLLLDQIYKYPRWKEDLYECSVRFPQLRIIYAGSSTMLDTSMSASGQLPGKVYHLRGFSLREFINLKTNSALGSFSFEDVVNHHTDIAHHILGTVNPLNWFNDYVHHGYYPIFLEPRNYSENLLKNINMMLEVDVMYVRDVDQKLLPKLRSLLYFLGCQAPSAPNISQIAKVISTSRATVGHYMHTLSDTGIVRQIYKSNDRDRKKPAMCFLDNTNIAYAIKPSPTSPMDIYTTFFLNQVSKDHRVDAGMRSQIHFDVDTVYPFKIEKEITGRYKEGIYYAVHGLNSGEKNVIPLWMFGFLY